MKAALAPPSFWPEPRDPWAWQRALRALAAGPWVRDPWPTWEGPLRNLLPRRAIPGLYGLKVAPQPPIWLGCGLLVAAEGGWRLHPEASRLAGASREDFQVGLAAWLVRRSPWVGLVLRGLASGAWRLPLGAAALATTRRLRVGRELDVPADDLEADYAAHTVCADVDFAGVSTLRIHLTPAALSALHSPLYLLHALGWLDQEGRPALPAELPAAVLPKAPATLLRRISAAQADRAGFVPFERAARDLWTALYGGGRSDTITAWADLLFRAAIARGSIEVHAWAPGQPRHGRGFGGDRNRKLVRWTVHDDFDLAMCGADELRGAKR